MYIATALSCAIGYAAAFLYLLTLGPADAVGTLIDLLMAQFYAGMTGLFGAILATFYALPALWALHRLRISGPIPVVLASALPGHFLVWLEYDLLAPLAFATLGYGLGAGALYCAIAYRSKALDPS